MEGRKEFVKSWLDQLYVILILLASIAECSVIKITENLHSTEVHLELDSLKANRNDQPVSKLIIES